MDLVSKHWNALKITYMGDNKIKILDMTIEYGDVLICHIDNIATFLSHSSKEDRDHFIYDKILHPYNKDNITHIELIKGASFY